LTLFTERGTHYAKIEKQKPETGEEWKLRRCPLQWQNSSARQARHTRSPDRLQGNRKNAGRTFAIFRTKKTRGLSPKSFRLENFALLQEGKGAAKPSSRRGWQHISQMAIFSEESSQ